MEREYYLSLAAQGLRMPIGADLILHEQENPDLCRLSGVDLGRVIVETARRFRTPLAFPLMDLKVEKEWLLGSLGVVFEQIDTYHFVDSGVPRSEVALERILERGPTSRMTASLDALRHVAETTELVPVGMCIGPFSLMTKLIADPISGVFDVANDPGSEEAQAVLDCLAMGTEVIEQWILLQIEAGAKAICVCEPAYNVVYLSPRQYRDDPGLLDLLVLDFNLRLKRTLESHGVDLIFHDCGELSDEIILSFEKLDPAVLSLGSPCDIPTIAHSVSPRTVLFGNLPTKKFFSDQEMPVERVSELSFELVERMKQTGHPFILGSECDVLCVPGCEHTIQKKIMVMVEPIQHSTLGNGVRGVAG